MGSLLEKHRNLIFFKFEKPNFFFNWRFHSEILEVIFVKNNNATF